MGNPVYPPPSEFPPGKDCYACTPTLYQSGKWPSVLWATFYELARCIGHAHPPNGHHFLLHQSVGGCDYTTTESYAGFTYYVQLKLETASLLLVNEDELYGDIFYAVEDPCTLIFPTNLLFCPLNAAELGGGIIRESPTPLASFLCSSYGLLPWGQFESLKKIVATRTRFESQPVAMDHTLIRLASRRDKSCIHVYIDDEDIP